MFSRRACLRRVGRWRGDGVEGAFVSLAAPESAELVYCGEETSSVPPGSLYEVSTVRVNKNGVKTSLKRRTPTTDGGTAYGRLNNRIRGLKEGRPDRELALVALPGASAAVARW